MWAWKLETLWDGPDGWSGAHQVGVIKVYRGSGEMIPRARPEQQVWKRMGLGQDGQSRCRPV